MAQGKAKEFIQRILLVVGSAAVSQAEVAGQVERQLQTSAAIQPLVEILIQKAGSDQYRVIGGDIPEVSVRKIQGDARMNLHAKREKALTNAGADRWNG